MVFACKEQDLCFENIVIGSCLSSVLYAYYNSIPIVLNSTERPFRFDKLSKEISFQGLNTDNKLLLWSWAAMQISMDGLCPFGPTASSIRVLEEDNTISITTGSGINFKAGFENCVIFDDKNVSSGLDLIEAEKPLFRVFDWMNVRTGMVHDFDYLETPDQLVKEVYFYKSERIDGKHDKKDLVSVSYLTEEELNSFEFSDTMARFKVERLMKDAGIRTLAGKNQQGRPRFESPSVQPEHRQVLSIGKNKYKNTKKVKFLSLSPEEVAGRYASRR